MPNYNHGFGGTKFTNFLALAEEAKHEVSSGPAVMDREITKELQQILASERKFEAAANLVDVDIAFRHVARAQRALRAVDQPVGKFRVETRCDDRESPAGAIGRRMRCRRLEVVLLHDTAAGSSKMCPIFARFVCM